MFCIDIERRERRGGKAKIIASVEDPGGPLPSVRMLGELDRALLKQALELGWGEWIKRCRGLPGAGPLTAMALIILWRRSPGSVVCASVVEEVGFCHMWCAGTCELPIDQYGKGRLCPPLPGQTPTLVHAAQCNQPGAQHPDRGGKRHR